MSWVESRSYEPIRGLDLYNLGLDEVYLNVSSKGLASTVWLYTLRAACSKCPYRLEKSLTPNEDYTLKLSSRFSWKFRVLDSNVGKYLSASNSSSFLCDVSEPWIFGEFGVYDLLIKSDGETVSCITSTVHEPVNIYLPILLLVLAGICMLSLLIAVAWMRNKFKQSKESENTHDNEKLPFSPGRRSAALDTFRGLCLIMLMFYNGGGGGYGIFEHTAWNGLPVADIPFPWFLWIMGACIPISINSALKKGYSRLTIFHGVCIRSLMLFIGGTVVSSVEVGNQLETFRLLGVLQRFGLLCLFCGGLCTWLWPRSVSKLTGEFGDIKALLPQWSIHLLLHIAHVVLTLSIAVPGCPRGYLGPGGLHDDMKYKNCTGGLAGYVDRSILGEHHMYPNATCFELYGTGRFEPEGVYTTLPAFLTVMLGIQAGAIMVFNTDWRRRASQWSVWGVICIFIAVILEYTGFIPINKNLWSTSFSLITAGLAFITLTLIYLVVDVCRTCSGAPLTYLGMNSLVMYLGSKITKDMWPWHWRFGRMDTHFMLLLDSCWSVALWLLIAITLFKRRIFIKI